MTVHPRHTATDYKRTTTRSDFFKLIFHDKHTYLHLYFARTTLPRGSIKICVYIPGSFWAIQHLTDTSGFKNHCLHDLHDLEEGRLILIR